MAAAADDIALIATNRGYDNLPNVAEAEAAEALGDTLARAGFEVLDISDFQMSGIAEEVGVLAERLRGGDRVIVYLAGHVVSTARDAFLLGTDAERLDPFAVGTSGLSIGAILDIVAGRPGAAIVAVADDRASLRPDAGVIEGFGETEVPQGVTVLTGPPRLLARFVTEEIVVPGRRIDRAVADAPRRIEALGFIGPFPFLAETAQPDAPDFEDRFWQRVTEEDSAEAYRDYLDRFPRGEHADAAETRISALTESDAERAARTEQELDLSRADRRELQEYLTVLGFDTRGIDGIFGPGSRRAIDAFQGDNGFERTGYLTANQITLLRTRGAARVAEVEAEAERQRAERERQDRQFWRDSGEGQDEAALVSYLDRYPDGIYAELARERLAVIEDRNRTQTEAEDRGAWEAAQAERTVAGYEAYLGNYPDGLFADDARAAIRSLESPETVIDLDRARDREDGLVLAASAKRLVEIRLQQLGYQPGPADGQFDRRTRRAIADYQTSRGIEATGFLDQGTVARLVAEAVFR
ncbi:peptidoglycan-binding domain-containing protein [Anianabacter salinae]|uniref:peptidoglycan-binding domain-containing protein n=1 Tax=Anianabacter salinae TaxID=2851023 RepID=UPI00225E156D|nr:peptidoglycan-binding domain-containing protein [Anianabacter salinae]